MFKSNALQFKNSLRGVTPRFEKKIADRIVATAHFVHKSLIDKTPVWEGQTVRNYIMTIGTGFSGRLEASGNGATGKTSKLALGNEPRRAENANAALESGNVLNSKNAFNKIFITNNSENVAGLERGELPDSARSRSPNGMFALTLEEVINRLNSKAL
jgi:hypothetical protein